ncbi:MAG: hypothetical protein QMD09_04545 [Desulfatibacillaceae bacterium]|nr:hypothetical protein [Desulfatibacillaceae bacterium]
MAALFMALLLVGGPAGCASKLDAKAPVEEPGPVYFDFGDVSIPPELSLSRKDSFVYQAQGFSSGVLVLSGKVELGKLLGFFEKNMIKDNWVLISTFKSPRSIMLFSKPGRMCVINVTEGPFSTSVEIWVAPTEMSSSQASSDALGLFK